MKGGKAGGGRILRLLLDYVLLQGKLAGFVADLQDSRKRPLTTPSDDLWADEVPPDHLPDFEVEFREEMKFLENRSLSSVFLCGRWLWSGIDRNLWN